MYRAILLGIISLLLLSFEAGAATKFIAQGGTAAWADCNAPSSNLSTQCPVSQIAANIAAGDVACYSGAGGPISGTLDTASAGSSESARIVIDGSGTGVCAGAMPATLSSSSTTAFFTIDQPYWTLKGFVYDKMGAGATARFITQLVGGDHLVIDGPDFFGSNDLTPANGWYAVLSSTNNSTSSGIDGIEIRNFSVANFRGQEAFRIVPRNATGGCAVGIKSIDNINVHDGTARNSRHILRTTNINTNETDYTSCMDGRPLGLQFERVKTWDMIRAPVFFDCRLGRLCRVGWNNFLNTGDGTVDTLNVIQPGKADGAQMVYNTIDGVLDAGGQGDGNGIIADHGGAYRALQSQYQLIAWNYVARASSNSDACGIMVWSADYTTVTGNILGPGNRNNVCVANSDVVGTRIINNTGFDPIDDNVEYSLNAAASELFNNNLVGGKYSVAVEPGSTAPTDGYNNLYGASVSQVSGTYTPAGTNISAPPKFIGGPNPTTAEGFKPFATSPLCGAGYPSPAKYDYEGIRFGNPPNIGAYGTCTAGRSSYSIRSTYAPR